MAKKKELIEGVNTPVTIELKTSLNLITESFGSGEVNILKDKINEIIKWLNS